MFPYYIVRFKRAVPTQGKKDNQKNRLNRTMQYGNNVDEKEIIEMKKFKSYYVVWKRFW